MRKVLKQQHSQNRSFSPSPFPPKPAPPPPVAPNSLEDSPTQESFCKGKELFKETYFPHQKRMCFCHNSCLHTKTGSSFSFWRKLHTPLSLLSSINCCQKANINNGELLQRLDNICN